MFDVPRVKVVFSPGSTNIKLLPFASSAYPINLFSGIRSIKYSLWFFHRAFPVENPTPFSNVATPCIAY